MSDYITIPLTKGQESIISAIDRDLSLVKWFAQSTRNGNFRAVRDVEYGDDRTVYYLGRIVLERKIGRLLHTGEQIAYINGNPLDNRRENVCLRLRVPYRDESGHVFIPLTKGYIAIIDEIDIDLSLLSWYASKEGNTWYAKRSERQYGVREIMRLHRLILARKIGRVLSTDESVDHIDMNGLNNCRDNLRLSSKSTNAMNTRVVWSNTGVRGVSYMAKKEKFRAYITYQGKYISLGNYDKIEDAIKARREAEEKYFGEFRRKE